jgi:hypothetical protein
MKSHALQSAGKLSSIYDSINEITRSLRQTHVELVDSPPKKRRGNRPTMQVLPNLNAIRPFVATMKSHKVVGWVRWGNEFGILALSSDGRFLRVNGSHTEILDDREVLRAIQASKHKWR